MKTLLLLAAAGGIALSLSSCGGEQHPNGTIWDPPCMPDGSVVNRFLPNDDGTYGDPRAKKENCPWYKK